MTKTERSQYFGWLSQKGCICTGKFPVQIHHVKDKTHRQRNDERVVPLCQEAHSTWHDKGPTAFKRRYDLTGADLMRKAKELREDYLASVHKF